MSEWIVSREDEASMFTFSAIEKDRALSNFIERNEIDVGFKSGGVVMGVPEELVEDFLEEFGVRGYNLERLA